MSNDLFYQFGITTPNDPIQHLKQVAVSLKNTAAHEQNKFVKEGYEIRIKNIEDFLALVEDSSGEIQCLEKTNIGEQALGIETILLTISIPKEQLVQIREKQKIVTQVYSPSDRRVSTAYFRITKIPKLFEWWEKGETRQESFGSVVDDTFRGFVKID